MCKSWDENFRAHSLIAMHIWDNFAEMHIILKMKIGIERNETNNTISSEQFASLKNGYSSSFKFSAYTAKNEAGEK